jgi:hypothetical protein
VESTEIIILRKTPYMESSIILSGLSPDYGKIDLLVKGEQKISGKKTPVVDLFREIAVSFHESQHSTLHTAVSIELVREHDNIAAVPENFKLATKIAEFILNNTQPELPCPQTGITLNNVLTHLAAAGNEEIVKTHFFDQIWNRIQSLILIKTGFLHENGFMPDNFSEDEEQNSQQQLFIEQIVGAGIGENPLPERANRYWINFNEWLNQICSFHNLKVPDERSNRGQTS